MAYTVMIDRHKILNEFILLKTQTKLRKQNLFFI